MREFEIVENNIASKGIRLANYIIDLIIFYLFMFTIGIFLGMIGADVRLILDNDFPSRLLGMFFYALFMFGTEISFGGKSIGKIITGTKVVTEYGERPTVLDLLTRNFSRIVPFDQFSFLGNLGWHDKWSNTRVVKAKSFDTEMLNNSSIEDIGTDSVTI
jgi:uncharacterized RDD family membrane protein YckC